MGGKGSKVYEMKVVDEDANTTTPANTHNHSNHLEIITEKNLNTINTNNENNDIPGKLGRRKSSTGVGIHGNNLTPSLPSSSNLLQQKSMKSLRGNSLKNMGRSGSMSGAGMLNLSTTTTTNSLQVSNKVSWLVKRMSPHQVADVEFKFGRIIGKGLMGTVHIASFTHENKAVYVAIKSIRKDYIIRHNDERHVRNEKEIMLTMSSPFCIHLFGTYQDQDNIHLVMEYCAGGELFRKLTKKKAFQPNMAKFYACEIFLALNHIHELGFVYRDLKPENIMLDESGHCKLIDFGFATRPNAQGMCLTNVGTPAYLSPEQLNGKFTNGYTKIVDWWSFGVLLYELLTGSLPFV